MPKNGCFLPPEAFFKIIKASFFHSQLTKNNIKTDIHFFKLYCAECSNFEVMFLSEDGAGRLRSKNKTVLYYCEEQHIKKK